MKTSDEDVAFKLASAESNRRTNAAMLDADIKRDVERGYSTTQSAADRRAGPTGLLNKIGRLWLKWDDQPRPNRRARNALKQLVGVPLTSENCTTFFDNSLRLGILEAISEETAYDVGRWNEQADNADGYVDDLAAKTGKSKAKAMTDLRSELQQNEAVRQAFRAALRVQPDAADVARVEKAMREFDDL